MWRWWRDSSSSQIICWWGEMSSFVLNHQLWWKVPKSGSLYCSLGYNASCDAFILMALIIRSQLQIYFYLWNGILSEGIYVVSVADQTFSWCQIGLLLILLYLSSHRSLEVLSHPAGVREPQGPELLHILVLGKVLSLGWVPGLLDIYGQGYRRRAQVPRICLWLEMTNVSWLGEGE